MYQGLARVAAQGARTKGSVHILAGGSLGRSEVSAVINFKGQPRYTEATNDVTENDALTN